MKKVQLQKMTAIAVSAAMGVILQFLSFPVLPSLAFLKIDFSDIPIMINTFLFGPLAGIATAAIRSLLHLVLTGPSLDNLVGDAASFLATSIFILPIYYFFKRNGEKKTKVAGLFFGVIALTVFMSIANYFVITPVYLMLFGLNAQQFLGMSLGKYILIGIVPFNLIKGFLVSVVFMVLYAKLLPWLSKKQRQSISTLHR